MKAVYRPDGILLQNIKRDEVDKINIFVAEMKAKGKMTENIQPRPVIRDGNGKRIKDYTARNFYLKTQEEIFEVIMAFKYSDKDVVAEEIADVITVCISYLNAIGYDEKGRSEIFRRVNETNEKRGYFKEAD